MHKYTQQRNTDYNVPQKHSYYYDFPPQSFNRSKSAFARLGFLLTLLGFLFFAFFTFLAFFFLALGGIFEFFLGGRPF